MPRPPLILLLILVLWVATDATAAAAAAAAGNGSVMVQTALLLASGAPLPGPGIAQLGQPVQVVCRVTQPAEVIMVRLRKLPLGGGVDASGVSEVFAASAGKQRLHSPWDSRPDVTFNGTGLSVRFNMTRPDEGQYRCDAVTLDGELAGNAAELLTAQAPTPPRLLFSGGGAGASVDRLEIVQGESVTVNCSANVGKPAGDIRLTLVSGGGGGGVATAAGLAIPGAANATWTGQIPGDSASDQPQTTVTTIFKSVVATVRIEEAHQNASFVCRLLPSPMATGGVHGNNDSAAADAPLVVTSAPVQALFEVRNIRLEPFRENFFHGDALLCAADGRPEPLIQWSKIQGAGELTVNGSRLLMPVGALPGYYSFTCSATNTVGGNSHQLLQSIGFNLHNRTAPEAAPSPSPPSVTTRVRGWIGRHHRGLTVGLICVGSLAGLALVSVMLACLCGGGGGYGRLGGSRGGSVRDRMRYYGELGDAGAMSSDEDEGDYLDCGGDGDGRSGARQPLNKAAAAAGGENGAKKWNGTQV